MKYWQARKSFRDTVNINLNFRLSRGKSSDTFFLSFAEYSYKSRVKARTAEQELGNKIIESLKNELNLTRVNHVQRKRRRLKIQKC